MAVGLKVVQVVGYQNSGKTTLVTKLIQILHEQGYHVGTIKHHGHGGEPNNSDNGKDTEQHRLAGAEVVAVEGEGTIQLTANLRSWNLPKILSLYENFPLDIVLVEGYKSAAFPKIVMLRDENDKELLANVSNIIAVISSTEIDQINYPSFNRKDDAAYLPYITNAVKGL